MKSTINLIFKRLNIIVAFMLIGGALCLVGSFLQPLKYASTMRLLVVPGNIGTVDPYTAFRSIDRISDNLSQVVYTTHFFNKVYARNPSLDQSFYPLDEQRKRKSWRKTVDVFVARGSGFFSVTAYHRDSSQATLLARSIADVLIADGWEYVGGDLEIKVVDTPLPSRFPAKPNILFNFLAGLIGGGVIGLLYVVWHEQGRKKHLFGIG